MDETNADLNAISGNGSPSDYDLLTGGMYSSSQDPYSAVDNGTVNNSTTGTGSASAQGTITPPAGGASYTPPSWLQSLNALTSSAASLSPIVTQANALINGRPVTGPAQAGQQATPGSPTFSLGGGISLGKIAIGVVLVLGALWFFTRRGR
jgi:hypothetical protein